MKKILIIILLTQNIIAQDIIIDTIIPNNITAEKILNNYFKKIGGIKKLNKINTLQKYFTVEIEETNGLNVYGNIMYKMPDLYASKITQEIGELKRITSTKYNGKNCMITRNYNGETSTSEIKGKILEEQVKGFTPFPLLYAKKNNISFNIIEIHKTPKEKLYKLYMNDPTNVDSVFFLFDANSHYLVKKEEIGKKNTKITEYKNYQQVDEYVFPFLENSIIYIDKKIAQKSAHKINQIDINKSIPKNEFE